MNAVVEIWVDKIFVIERNCEKKNSKYQFKYLINTLGHSFKNFV